MRGDPLSPIYANSPLDRARLLNVAPEAAARMQLAVMDALGMDADAIWRTATDRDERGLLSDERARLTTWRMLGGDVEAARAVWEAVNHG